MLFMSDDKWQAMPKPEQDAAIKRECDDVIRQLDMIAVGLAVQRAGLIWFLPLCHDAYGENV